MVDWEAVEKARTKGWDWDRIASEPKVGFHAEEDAGDPGRALRALYYQRRSKQQRRPTKAEGGGSGKGADADQRPPWTLARIGYLLVPLAGIWFVLALVYPTPIGIYFPAIPYVGLILAVSGFVLVWGLLRTQERWSKAMRTSVVAGVALGLVIVGGFTLVAEFNNCPTLPAISGSEPQGWEKANAAAWKENGVPVFFYFGSIACPYCSASSWAINMALERFGTVTGTSYALSNPNEPPRVPEIDLSSASVRSQYVSFNVLEGTNDNAITTPPANTCIQQAYVSAYDSGGSIPFLVINGQYVHVGTIVAISTLQGLSPEAVAGQLASQSEPAWSAVSPAAFMLMAFIVKANGGQPQNVATDGNVAPLLAQIT